jgi:hypothetical protein
VGAGRPSESRAGRGAASPERYVTRPARRCCGKLRECYAAPDERLRATRNLFADHLPSQRAIEQFWLDTLGLPRACLLPSVVNVFSKYSQKKRRNKLPYGTCKLAYNDTATVQSIYGAIQEYAGFDRTAWLD